MKKEIIYTEKAVAPTAPYSQAIRCGNRVFLAGACGDDPVTGEIMGDGDMKIEARYCMENLKATIEAAGGTMNDFTKVRVFVTDLAQLPDFNEVYETFFTDGYLPARIAMQIVALAGGAHLEVEAEAVLD